MYLPLSVTQHDPTIMIKSAHDPLSKRKRKLPVRTLNVWLYRSNFVCSVQLAKVSPLLSIFRHLLSISCQAGPPIGIHPYFFWNVSG